MGQGKLVPDDLVNEMVAVRLAEPDTRRGYILDGYPRTLAQASALDALLDIKRVFPELTSITTDNDIAEVQHETGHIRRHYSSRWHAPQ